MKIVKKNQLKIFIFTAVKNRCILHGRVLVMQVFQDEAQIEMIIGFMSHNAPINVFPQSGRIPMGK